MDLELELELGGGLLELLVEKPNTTARSLLDPSRRRCRLLNGLVRWRRFGLSTQMEREANWRPLSRGSVVVVLLLLIWARANELYTPSRDTCSPSRRNFSQQQQQRRPPPS